MNILRKPSFIRTLILLGALMIPILIVNIPSITQKSWIEGTGSDALLVRENRWSHVRCYHMLYDGWGQYPLWCENPKAGR